MKEIKETEEREKLDWGRKNKNDKKKNIEKEENDEDMKARKNQFPQINSQSEKKIKKFKS